MKKQGTGIGDQGPALPQVSSATAKDLKPPGWSRFIGPGVVLLAAAVALTPQFFRGNSCGHDFDFHLASWIDARSAWQQGILYPRWTASANYGAGEPRFIFYSPLTWMMGAGLGFILPWTLVPAALTFLLLAATGLATRALARATLGDVAATLAGCSALFSGYVLFCAYERSAFGELTGGFWIPLILLFILCDLNPSGSLVQRTLDGSAVPLALAVSGAWLSNIPVGIMACYMLAAVALAAALLAKSWAPVLRASVAAALGIGLAAIYLVPATWEQGWIAIRQATDDPGEMVENSWLFGRHADPLLALHDVELHKVSIIAAVMIALALGGLLVAWRRKTLPEQRRLWIPLVLIPAAILFLQLPVSLPVWNVLPKLRLLQFPWRWLVALEAPVAISLVWAIWPGDSARLWRRVGVAAACVAAFVAMTSIAGQVFYQICYPEDTVPAMLDAYRAGLGFAGTDEYAPIGADDTMVATGLPFACLAGDPATELGTGGDNDDIQPIWDAGQGSCEATFARAPYPGQTQYLHMRVAAVTPHAGYLILRLRTYPAWQVKVNGRAAAFAPARDDGLMAVAVPQGAIDLTVDWTTTTDIAVGRWLSALALALVTALCAVERRWRRPRLS
jgi:hypothetical protein